MSTSPSIFPPDSFNLCVQCLSNSHIHAPNKDCPIVDAVVRTGRAKIEGGTETEVISILDHGKKTRTVPRNLFADCRPPTVTLNSLLFSCGKIATVA